MSDVCAGLHRDTPPEPEIGALCLRCWSRLRSTLVGLPAVATWLEVNLAVQGNPGAERVGGSRNDPIPLRVNVLDLIGPDSRRFVEPDPDHLPLFLLWEDGLVVGYYGTWRDAQQARVEEMRLAGVEAAVIDLIVRQHTRLELRESEVPTAKLVAARERWQIRPTQPGGTDQQGADAFRAALMFWARTIGTESGAGWRDIAAADLSTLVGWISARLSWVAEQEWVGEFLTDLTTMTAAAHKVAPWRPERRHDTQPCPACNVRAVVLHIAEGISRCERGAGGCGRQVHLSEYALNTELPKTRRAG